MSATADQARTCAALAQLGYAHLAAQSRGEPDRARILLELFQQLYGQYRSAVVACLAVDGSRLSPAPGVTGDFDARSRDALLAAVATSYPRESIEALLAMPDRASAIPGWFPTFNAAAAPGLRELDQSLARFTGEQLLDEASDHLFHAIEGGPSTPVAIPAPDEMFAPIPFRRSYPHVDLAASIRQKRLFRAVGALLLGAALGLGVARFAILRWA